jgi:MOSC domain-containing protein YiiM
VHQSADQLAPAGSLLSVNVGVLRPNAAKLTWTAIGKVPAAGPVLVRAPGSPKGESGLAGDAIGDKENHGGDDQAVYAYSREDLDEWEGELARSLPDGAFGENLTTVGVNPNGALIGERWQVGDEVVLQVTSPRIPCKTFATWLSEAGWLRRFRSAGKPGAYLRVLKPGLVRCGDPVTVVHRPAHDVTVALAFRALTTEPQLLGALLAAREDLPEEMRESALAGAG